MAVQRSPNYPQMDLGDALESILPAYKAEGRNKMSRLTLASHLGYSSLNGRALAKIGAVRAYGLIDGREDDIRVAPDAITCIEAPEGSRERFEALQRCAVKPPVFKDISTDYEGLPSEQNLRFALIQKGYAADAAGKAAQNYLATMRLVDESGGAFSELPVPAGAQSEAEVGRDIDRQSLPKEPPLSADMRKAVFTLDEGDVTLTFPQNLSEASYSELGDYLAIFLKRAQRQRGGQSE